MRQGLVRAELITQGVRSDGETVHGFACDETLHSLPARLVAAAATTVVPLPNCCFLPSVRIPSYLAFCYSEQDIQRFASDWEKVI